jgi:hypothetical protein
MGKHLQLELFKPQHYQQDRKRRREYRLSFFGFIRLHEKAISFIIVFFIVSLISFSLGVEKGKSQAVVVHEEGRREITGKTNPVKKQIQPEKSETAKVFLAKKLEDKLASSKYTVQVASFKTKTYAQKEANRLEKRGIKSIIMPIGKYIIVCVGSFSQRQEAKTTLNKMRETYRDCFIREL